jgi:hypothetical protein
MKEPPTKTKYPSVPTGHTAVLVVLRDEVIRDIDAQLIHQPLSLASRAGFVRSVIYDYLGREMPDTNTVIPERSVFQKIDLMLLEPDSRRATELFIRGESMSQISRIMLRENWPTRQGGVWHHHTVRKLLIEALRKGGIWQPA